MTENTPHQQSLKIWVLYTAPIITFLVLAGVLNATDPLASGALSILVVFVLIYLFILSTLSVLFHIVALIVRLVSPGRALQLRTGYYLLSVASLAPVLFIALNTLGQLDILECSLIVIFVGLGCFYIVRRTSK